jgi:PfaB family protein
MSNNEPIAVVRMAGLFPGALDVDAYWRNMEAGFDAVTDVPPGRWHVPPDEIVTPQPGPPDRAYARRGGFVQGFKLDPRGLGLPESLVAELDPLFQWVLSVGRDLFASAQGPVNRDRTGVVLANLCLASDAFASLGRTTLRELARVSGLPHAAALTTGEPRPHPLNHYQAALPAGLLARSQGLRGGTMALDAACASSLYAIKLACDRLREGVADAMVAGGVSRTDHQCLGVGFSQLRAYSRTGWSRPFDAAADGLVPGEGCGLVLLKRLADAQADGDEVLAVIRAVGLSNDGKGRGVLMPMSEGQIRAIRAAYAECGLPPTSVQHVECHATGTTVGDAAEVHSLKTVWGRGTPGSTALGSAKSNLGHLLTAAGIAGFVKTVQALRHKVIPPTINFERLPAGSTLDDTPFYISQRAHPWPENRDGMPRRAGCSAFGFGGCNAHLVVEEGPPRTSGWVTRPPAPKPQPEPLAVVAVAARWGQALDVEAYRELLFEGRSILGQAPPGRWLGTEGGSPVLPALPGAYVGSLTVHDPMGLRIPPLEFDRMLPQQLLSILVAEDLMRQPEAQRAITDKSRVGVAVGMAMEGDASDYAFRWATQRDAAHAKDESTRQGLLAIANAYTFPITAEPVLGFLANLVANRVSSRFDLGGASLAVAAEDASALKALEVAALMLRRGEIDVALVAGVDLPGDVRALLAVDAVQGYTRGEVRPFDKRADGTLPGEGAGMVLLKRLQDAQAAGDRVLAVVRGIGSASDGAKGDVAQPSAEGHELALERAYADAGLPCASVGLLFAHGSGRPREDAAEVAALHRVFRRPRAADGKAAEPGCALGTTKPLVGHTGAASGMASLVAAVLALHHRALPPAKGLEELGDGTAWKESPFYVLRKARPWLADRAEEPRRAAVSVLSVDGNHAHVVLEEAPGHPSTTVLGRASEQLFVLRGTTRDDVVSGLEGLKREAAGADLERLAKRRAPGREPRHHGLTCSLVVTDEADLRAKADKAIQGLRGGAALINDVHGIYFAQEPLARSGKLAFVFPGAGNAYPGMARELVLRFPAQVDDFAGKTVAARARSMERWTLPRALAPKRSARDEVRTAQEMIWGAGYFTQMLADVIRHRMNILPDAALGYSLGESSGMFALGAWNCIDELDVRLGTWPLFTRELAGPMEAVLRAWERQGVDVEGYRGKPFWANYLLVSAPEAVLPHLREEPLVHLAITNAPDECVISGLTEGCKRVIDRVKCSAHLTPFAAAVHVPEVEEVIDQYRELHTLPTTTPPGVTYYSSGTGRPYVVNAENVAESIVRQALRSVDFPALVRNSHDDGIRLYVEVGPRGSCTRWIEKILEGRDFLAVASDRKGRSEMVNLMHLGGVLAAHGVPVDVAGLYAGQEAPPVRGPTPGQRVVPVGKIVDKQRLAPVAVPSATPVARPPPPPLAPAPVVTPPPVAPPPPPPRPVAAVPPSPAPKVTAVPQTPVSVPVSVVESSSPPAPPPAQPGAMVGGDDVKVWSESLGRTWGAMAQAHRSFLEGSRQATEALARMASLVPTPVAGPSPLPTPVATVTPALPPPSAPPPAPPPPPPPAPVVSTPLVVTAPPGPPPVFDYAACLEFAQGRIGNVFGPAFASIDAYPVRVRLPAPPLLLCHRVTALEAQPNVMEPSCMHTESDITADAFHVYRNTVPCGITVESGQADLMLISYLGIDHIVKGEKRYRLLDCHLTYEDKLPAPGDVLHYKINIDKFVEQAGTHLFFFRYVLTVGDRVVLRMNNGCAGFFSQEALDESRGIVLPAGYKPRPPPQQRGEVVPALCRKTHLTDAEFARLCAGDPYGCFGEGFEVTRQQRDPVALPGGRMQLLHRVTKIDPTGGTWGRGMIEAETDVHPDDWFFPCHFTDDQVMAGSLMYETCAQALQTFMLHLGHGLEYPDGAFHPVVGQTAKVKCRGQVLTSTRKITYRVDIMERGTEPEPYAIGEANCWADGFHMVRAENLSARLVGERVPLSRSRSTVSVPAPTPPVERPVFTREQVVAHGLGTPSELWGPDYACFDKDRRMARLPNGPYLLMDRVTQVGMPPRTLKAGGWLVGEYDVPRDAWYFTASDHPTMPFSVLLEVFLQPCGFLCSYVGSDLRSQADRRFRNLGGHAVLNRDVTPGCGTLRTRATLTKFSEYSDLLVLDFDIVMELDGQVVMEGDSYFGFFTDEAMSKQKGLNGKLPPNLAVRLPQPVELKSGVKLHDAVSLAKPPLLMTDRLVAMDPAGGRHGKGYARSEKVVDPGEWFFKAHFHQDPVMPGSLGIEGVLQMMQAYMMRLHPEARNVRFEPLTTGRKWEWTYRGQVIQPNKLVTMEMEVLEHQGGAHPSMVADAFLLVDGLPIYRLDGVGMRMVPRS